MHHFMGNYHKENILLCKFQSCLNNKYNFGEIYQIDG